MEEKLKAEVDRNYDFFQPNLASYLTNHDLSYVSVIALLDTGPRAER
jgi:hypothetical protein